LRAKAASYGLDASTVDGMDVLDVDDAAARAVAQVREGAGPVFLELRTYRFRPHSMFDAELYRDKAEVARWKERGPVKTLVERLTTANLATMQDIEAIERAVDVEVDQAVAFARAGTLEPVDELSRFVYAEDALNRRLRSAAS
jgi:TPP-dependent pyruvate/acetoin dehydrogenase alpha subunit